MKKLLLLIFVFSLISCGSYNKIPYRQGKKIWTCQGYYQKLGRYDTNQLIKGNFLKGTSTIIHLSDNSCVVIWGKKCKFQKDELLFVKGEYWSSMRHCKYFLVNEPETLKYSLLDRK